MTTPTSSIRTLTAAVALLALAFAAPALLADGADAAKKGKKKEPDLVVTQAALSSEPYAFRGENNTISFTDRTKNKGKATAKKSRTFLLLTTNSGGETPATSRGVPKLESRESHAGNATKTFVVDPGFPPGIYSVAVCADYKDKIKEKDEDNNCEILDDRFYITESVWSGTINGTGCLTPGLNGQCGDAKETWSSNNASFEFVAYASGGRFQYVFSGTVSWAAAGTDIDDCTWSGAGSQTFSRQGGTMLVDYDNAIYTARLEVDQFYDVTKDCPGVFDDGTEPGPVYDVFLRTFEGGTVGSDLPLPDAATVLEGTVNGDFIFRGPSSMSWRLG
jgi:CARDB